MILVLAFVLSIILIIIFYIAYEVYEKRRNTISFNESFWYNFCKFSYDKDVHEAVSIVAIVIFIAAIIFNICVAGIMSSTLSSSFISYKTVVIVEEETALLEKGDYKNFSIDNATDGSGGGILYVKNKAGYLDKVSASHILMFKKTVSSDETVTVRFIKYKTKPGLWALIPAKGYMFIVEQ